MVCYNKKAVFEIIQSLNLCQAQEYKQGSLFCSSCFPT